MTFVLHTTLMSSPCLVMATCVVPVGGAVVSSHPCGRPVLTIGPKFSVAVPVQDVGSSALPTGLARISAVTVSVLANDPATVLPSIFIVTEYVMVFLGGTHLAAAAGPGVRQKAPASRTLGGSKAVRGGRGRSW